MNKKPLYRKVNTTARGVHHRTGGDYRTRRRCRSANRNTAPMIEGMGGRKNRGLDYTPLFRFLISKIGQDWNSVHSEAVARLDRPDPIFWLVAMRKEDEQEAVRTGEASYFSGLRVDADGTLQLVNPEIGVDSLDPQCKCCTHTLNGERFTRAFDPDRVPQTSEWRVF